MLIILQGALPGCIPELIHDLVSIEQQVPFPTRRESAFPRVIRKGTGSI